MFTTPRGTRDFSFEEMERRIEILENIRNVYECYGFRPIDTPAFENFELLASKGGDEIKKEIYYFRDKANRELGLRFDLTLPMARFVSSNPTIKLPFKRYHIAKVWRYEEPQNMRYRELMQADVDIVGSKSVYADAECVACVSDALKACKLTNFDIRFNSRILMEKIANKLGVKDKLLFFRTIDKTHKVGLEVTIDMLSKMVNNIEILEEIMKKHGNSALKIVEELIGEVEDIENFLDAKKSLAINNVIFDISIVRGLDYYTGLVFEIKKDNLPTFSAGGRYDNLIRDIGGKDLPATGMSIGIDRLESILNKDWMKLKRKRIFFVIIGKVEKGFEIIKNLRRSGIVCEFDLMGRKIKNQIEYAIKSNFNYLIFFGEDEYKSGYVKIRNIKTREETEVKIDSICKVVENEEI